MSIDFDYYTSGASTRLEDLKQVYTGKSVETEQDYTYLVMTIIPVLLKTEISREFRSFLLRQYAEITGARRDLFLSNLTRSDFYRFAADEAGKESNSLKQRKASSARGFEDIIDFMDEDTAEDIRKTAEEHDLFKSQLADMIKSVLGIPVEATVGVDEIKEYQKLVTFNG